MTSTISTNSIVFPNNREATAVSPPAGATAQEILDALGIKPHKAVLLIIGGADSIDEKLKPQLTQLFGRGIARAAVNVDAVIIDGGTAAGVMAMMGQGVADRCFQSTLVGVAPLGKVTYPGAKGDGDTQLDPNHSHFVLAEGDSWGSETNVIFKLVCALRSRAPAVVLLAGGGATTKREALQAVRQNLPLLAVEGSGGLADEIAVAWKAKPKLPDDPLMAEIIADGRIEFYHISKPVSDAESLLILALSGDNVLFQAWGQFAEYDLNANLQQTRFQWLQMSIIVIGILGTALALVNQTYAPKAPDGNILLTTWDRWWSIHYLLIAVPILLTILITAANRFKQGNKWLLLRAGAEAIKREIYRYRARAGDYSEKGSATAVGTAVPPLDSSPGATSTTTTSPSPEPKPPPPTPEQVLAQRVEDITRRTMRTEVNVSALKPYDKQKGFPPDMYAAQGGDDGLSVLTPNRYVQVRLGDQLAYYKRRAVKLERQLKFVQWSIFVVGGLGTLLAAINRQVWIALTTAVAAALTTFLSYKQTESTLMKYNQAWTDLGNVKAWWTALPPEEQAKSANVTTLVDHTEQVLQSELDGWVQQMQNALAELRKGQEKAPETKYGAATPPTDEQQAAITKQEAETAAKKAGDGGGGGADKDVNKDANKVVDPNKAAVVVDPNKAAPAVGPGNAVPAVDPNKDASVDDAAKNTPKTDTGSKT